MRSAKHNINTLLPTLFVLLAASCVKPYEDVGFRDAVDSVSTADASDQRPGDASADGHAGSDLPDVHDLLDIKLPDTPPEVADLLDILDLTDTDTLTDVMDLLDTKDLKEIEDLHKDGDHLELYEVGSCDDGFWDDGTCLPLPHCGDELCLPGETCENCAEDCGCGGNAVCWEGGCCTPACDGKECGDDKCGGSCGTCDKHYECDQNQCKYVPWCGDSICDGTLTDNCDTCPEDCACTECGETCIQGACAFTACDGKECGGDGCGGSCGICGEYFDCSNGTCVDTKLCGNGQCDVTAGESCASCLADCACTLCGQTCESGSCTFTACNGRQCGDDGCGGSCGVCNGLQESCLAGTCVCESACDGKQCGDDGCGGSCGTCDRQQDECVEGTCICLPTCEGKQCGDDGCGGTCGLCEGPQDECVLGACICQPLCTGKQCGDDGCGATCGQCVYSDQTCEDGVCATACINSCDKELLVPAGKFWMGCNEAEDDACIGSEKPQHEVYLDAYYIDRSEVTVGEYGACVSGGGCMVPGMTGSRCNWGKTGRGSHPINCVTWIDARAYCEWAGKRLPTEAEWEKAARGGCEENGGEENCKIQNRTYPWGEQTPSCLLAAMNETGVATGYGCGTGATLPVCSKSPNGDSPFGLCDMAGNVWEWTGDWYSGSYYSGSPAANPLGPAVGTSKVRRGGGFVHTATSHRSSERTADSQSTAFDFLGFRCARSGPKACGDGICSPSAGEDCETCPPDCGCVACGQTCLAGECTFTACDGKACGDNGCQGTCGVCTGPHDECIANQCICQPQCSDKHCGEDDGCGGECGCPTSDQFCDAGVCKTQCEHDCDGEVLVSAGDFWMGCNSLIDTACSDNETPYSKIHLSAYLIDKSEVTTAAYAACVNAGNCSSPSTGNSYCNWGKPGKNLHPVNCVTWQQADDYCRWAGKRLPSEAEWEKAARGGCEYYGGEAECQALSKVYPTVAQPPTCDLAVIFDGKYGCGTDSTGPVCSKSPAGDTVYGICDMAGNVSEWTNDWYSASYYSVAPPVDPRGPPTGEFHTRRGGAFVHDGMNQRLSDRTTEVFSNQYSFLGFRCARTCTPDCSARLCGEDGCGGSCGTCTGLQDECIEGVCVCQPTCDAKQCGDDGCGGSCGACADGQHCQTGVCVTDGFVRIPAGSFWMGSPDGTCPEGYPGACTAELGRNPDREALHYVQLTRDFEIQAHEVTQGEWKNMFGGTNPSGYSACGESCPVEQVSWFSVLEYANALSLAQGYAACYTVTGCTSGTAAAGTLDGCTVTVTAGGGNPYNCNGYRLPTESEWEYAYRAGSTTAFYPSTGNDGTITQMGLEPLDPNLDKIGWYGGNSKATYAGATNCSGWFAGSISCGTQPYGGKAPNAWGLQDMSGNVFEWVWDRLLHTYPSGSPAAPVLDPLGADSGSNRVRRGASWSSSAPYCRGADRNNAVPGYRDNNLGFRLARTVGNTCQPDCTGKHCGDDGCGGSCGTCTGLQDECIEGVCVCQPDCNGRVCGDDGCGGSCGSCPLLSDACVDGQCVCQPDCGDNTCGGDGCGGTCPACGPGFGCSPEGTCVCGFQCTAGCCPPLTGYTPACNAKGFCEYTSTETQPWRNKDVWIYIPPASFPFGPVGYDPVTVSFGKGYFAAKHEIHVSAYDACFAAGSCPALSDSLVYTGVGWGLNKSADGRQNHPQNGLSFPQATSFCSWVVPNGRLLSDSEWEYAARAATRTLYPWGDAAPSCAAALAIYDEDSAGVRPFGCNSCTSTGCSGTSAVGSVPAGQSPFGLMDMSGNVSEWVLDAWSGDYLLTPTDGSPYLVGDLNYRTYRNGAFEHSAASMKVDFKGVISVANRSADFGARCAIPALNVCEPQCEGRVCGDDRCGGVCGTCTGLQDQCIAGGCICQPACDGKQCGDDGCGGSCGSCNVGQTCQTSMCVTAGFVPIPAGSFWMGSPDGTCPEGYPGTCTAELGRGTTETLHYVRLTRAFEMQEHEVTQGEWKNLFGGANPSYYPTCGDSCPVEQVSWFSALQYANALSVAEGYPACYAVTDCTSGTAAGGTLAGCSISVTGSGGNPLNCSGYRLPTESEWEYAYRAGSTTAFYPSTGNDGSITQSGRTPLDPNLDKIAWYGGNSYAGYAGAANCSGWYAGATKCGPQPVGGKVPNAWGLHDMSGNLLEWVWDQMGASYPEGTLAAPAVDPLGGVGPSGRVVRGGSWFDETIWCRAALRHSASWGYTGQWVGFRLVRTLQP